VVCGITSVISALGVFFGVYYLKSTETKSVVEAFARYDGQHYKRILEFGYSYSDSTASEVAFFPLYPLFGRMVARTAEVPATKALLTVTYVSFGIACLLFWHYLHMRDNQKQKQDKRRCVPETGTPHVGWQGLCLISFCVLPTTFFFRMAYSESLFVALCIAVLLGIVRFWPLSWLALLTGLATATRPVGVALLPPLLWHVWQEVRSWRRFAITSVWLVPIATWGLIAYIGLLGFRFGDPFGFASTQEFWRIRLTTSTSDKVLALLIAEPLWSVYVPGSPAYWRSLDPRTPAVFNLTFANPIYFVGTTILISFGAWKRCLNMSEALLSAGLLLIPYITRSYEMCMASHGRFAAVVFPVFIVLGRILALMPIAVSIAILAACGALLCLYSAMFSAGYALY
jgi:hypothetical protein